MIPDIRATFNEKFSESSYRKMIEEINRDYEDSLDFRICETPLFLSEAFENQLIVAAEDILQTLRNSEFLKKMAGAIPPGLEVSGESTHVSFVVIDFAITRDRSGKLTPKLIELQGFPTTFCFEWMLDQKIRQHFYIPEGFSCYYNGLNHTTFLEKLRRMLLRNHDPENVILLEIEPREQKTRIDFVCTERHLGIRTRCISEIIERGKRLFYRHRGREIPIKRIYNRMIFDELIRKNISPGFFFKEQLEIEWIPHPNWFFKISKYSLPELSGDYCPECYYLEQLRGYPSDLKNYVLKPLFSFAGSGVELEVTPETLETLENKENYILQEKVDYAPVLRTPYGPAKAEVRMLYFWDKDPLLVQNHVRVSRGKMMGVDFNKNKKWVGSSITYHNT